MLDAILTWLAILCLLGFLMALLCDIKRSRAAERYYREQTIVFRNLIKDAMETGEAKFAHEDRIGGGMEEPPKDDYELRA